jgi:putative colanic acid biosynthesis UDP-glucose lipid carrier transferase
VGLLLIGFAIVFPNLSLGRGFRGVSIYKEIKEVSFAVALAFFALVLIALFTKSTASYSRIWFLEWMLFTWAGLIGYRILLRYALRWFRSYGFNQRSIVVVGSGEIASTVIARITSATWSGFQIEAIFGDDKAVAAEYLADDIKRGGFSEVADFVQQQHIDQVWIAMPLKRQEEIKGVMEDLNHCTADIRYVPDIFDFKLFNHSMSEVAGLPVMNLTASPMEGVNRVFKAIEDRLLAFLILLLFSPFMLVIALITKLSSPGPVFYKQVRLGWNGKKINMYKFRTMPINAEVNTGPIWSHSNDERATRFGAFLRRTSLDEFPQFFNVLRGDMSIVGPRPERPIFVEQFKEEIPQYMKKHMVKAGITGWAQVNGWRGDTSLHERVKHDLYYIENWSLGFDIKIIFMTLVRGFVHKNAY